MAASQEQIFIESTCFGLKIVLRIISQQPQVVLCCSSQQLWNFDHAQNAYRSAIPVYIIFQQPLSTFNKTEKHDLKVCI
jgi:hypothetical protein